MARTAVLGFPRIGAERELKTALEDFWAGGSAHRRSRRRRPPSAPTTWSPAPAPASTSSPWATSPSTTTCWTRPSCSAFGPSATAAWSRRLESHFVACRGAEDVAPLEMTKWFDTNYHYLVPELIAGPASQLRPDKWLRHLREARPRSRRPPGRARTAVAAPAGQGLADPLDAARPRSLPLYRELLAALADVGAREVQLDEPCLVQDRSAAELDAFRDAYAELCRAAPVEVCLATYFGELDRPTLRAGGGAADRRAARRPRQRPRPARRRAGGAAGRRPPVGRRDRRPQRLARRPGPRPRPARPSGRRGRQRAPHDRAVLLAAARALQPEREDRVDPGVRAWLAFGREKLDELALLGRALDAAARAARRAARRRPRQGGGAPVVRARQRRTRAATRWPRSAPPTTALASAGRALRAPGARLELPDLPTTTIGSFPQTAEIRDARRRLAPASSTQEAYDAFLRGQIERIVAEQESLGLDVLVHGEPERNDMVEFFGEQLTGFAFSRTGWVQSLWEPLRQARRSSTATCRGRRR